MAQHETVIGGKWVDGKIVVRTGESINFEGTVTGVTIDGIELTFNADGEDTYRYSEGHIPGFAPAQVQTLIVKHVEQALMDEGFQIDPKAASEDYVEE